MASNKREETLIKKYGSKEAYDKQRKEWSSKGGKKSPTNFKNLDPEKQRKIAKKGHQKMLASYGLKYEEINE